MKIIVLGAGVIGVTTAYYLARAGAEVRVLDRQPGPGMETSFANAGELSYGMTSPWAAPGIPTKAVKWLFMRHRPLFIWPMIDRRACGPGARGCSPTATRRPTASTRAAWCGSPNYSRDALTDLLGEVPLDFDQRELGTLQLFRTEKQVEGVEGRPGGARRIRLALRAARRDECIAVEPGLRHVAGKFVGGPPPARRPHRRLPHVHARPRRECRGSRRLLPLRRDDQRSTARRATAIAGVETDQGPRDRRRLRLLRSARYAPILLRTVGIRLPIYPIKGYSITLPVTDDAAAPVSTVMDETHKVAITRLGDRIRVAGQAEIIGYNATLGRAPPTPSATSSPTSSRRAATSRGPKAGPACAR